MVYLILCKVIDFNQWSSKMAIIYEYLESIVFENFSIKAHWAISNNILNYYIKSATLYIYDYIGTIAIPSM